MTSMSCRAASGCSLPCGNDDADLVLFDARRTVSDACRVLDLLGLAAEDHRRPPGRQREDRQRDDADADHLAIGDLVVLGLVPGTV
jgi:hypothetical protein